MAKTIDYSKEKIDSLLRHIYDGEITPTNLPTDLYKSISENLKDSLYKGFGKNIDKLSPDNPQYELLASLRDNIEMFSAAKTFQVVNELHQLANTTEGKVYEEQAAGIFALYNDTWQETEANTATALAQSAEKWDEIERNKEALPYLKWNAVVDGSTDEECLALDGLCLPVDDPFWEGSNPPLHWGCRCLLEQIDNEKEVSSEAEKKEAEATIDHHADELFNFNAWKEQKIFPEDHPYFDVPKEYTAFAKENFGLPMSEDSTLPSSLSSNSVDGVLTLKRQQLHEDIIQGMDKGAVQKENPIVYMNGGGPASGKSAVTEGIAKRPDKIFNIDSDEIKKELPEYNKMLEKKDFGAANFVHEESSMISMDALKYGIDKKYDVLLDGTGDGTYESLQTKINFMKSNGAKVVADYVTLDTGLAWKIQQKRALETGRDVPEAILRRTHANVSMVVPQAIKDGLYDEFRLWDTNIKGKARLVCELKNGKFEILKPDLWQDFLNKAKP